MINPEHSEDSILSPTPEQYISRHEQLAELDRLKAQFAFYTQTLISPATTPDEKHTAAKAVAEYAQHPDSNIREAVRTIIELLINRLPIYEYNDYKGISYHPLGTLLINTLSQDDLRVLVTMCEKHESGTEGWMTTDEYDHIVFELLGSLDSPQSTLQKLEKLFFLPIPEKRSFEFHPLIERNETALRINEQAVQSLNHSLALLKTFFSIQEPQAQQYDTAQLKRLTDKLETTFKVIIANWQSLPPDLLISETQDHSLRGVMHSINIDSYLDEARMAEPLSLPDFQEIQSEDDNDTEEEEDLDLLDDLMEFDESFQDEKVDEDPKLISDPFDPDVSYIHVNSENPLREEKGKYIFIHKGTLYELNQNNESSDYNIEISALPKNFPTQIFLSAWGEVLWGPKLGRLTLRVSGWQENARLHGVNAYGQYAQELLTEGMSGPWGSLYIDASQIDIGTDYKEGYKVQISYHHRLKPSGYNQRTLLSDTPVTISFDCKNTNPQQKWEYETASIVLDRPTRSIKFDHPQGSYIATYQPQGKNIKIELAGENVQKVLTIPAKMDAEAFVIQSMDAIAMIFQEIGQNVETFREQHQKRRTLTILEQLMFEQLGYIGETSELTALDSERFSPKQLEKMTHLDMVIRNINNPLLKKIILAYCYELTHEVKQSREYYHDKIYDSVREKFEDFFRQYNLPTPDELLALCEDAFPIVY